MSDALHNRGLAWVFKMGTCPWGLWATMRGAVDGNRCLAAREWPCDEEESRLWEQHLEKVRKWPGSVENKGEAIEQAKETLKCKGEIGV